jgi:response regulator RpfG family c-di-GMP phosphodiesterase
MNNKILYVDDADDVRTTMAQMLGRRWQVTTARDAQEAMERFEQDGPFPVVISDYSMPGMDGLSLLKEIGAHAPETVSILLTGVADQKIAAECVQQKIFRMLAKPCGWEQLYQAVDEALAFHVQFLAHDMAEEELKFSKDSLESFTMLLEERLDHQTDALRRLHRFSLDLCSARGLKDVVDLAAQAAFDVLGGRGVHVQVWDASEPCGFVERGLGPEMSSHMHTMPLATREGAIGEIVVDLHKKSGDKLADADAGLLASIASATAVAAHHEFRRRERDKAQQATILALARLAERRDNETGKHLERVAAYCRIVAQQLRDDPCHRALLTDSWIDDLERSSALHDIGKVGIPDSILLKPGRLTPEEWQVMRTHADIGAQTLDGVIGQFGDTGFLQMGRDIALHHHEKWDGSGYPRGLAGAKIPLAARILALADVYDALTTNRPYKSAWSHPAALDWIRARSGAHFDPDVVNAFLVQREQFDTVRQRLADDTSDLGSIEIQTASIF